MKRSTYCLSYSIIKFNNTMATKISHNDVPTYVVHIPDDNYEYDYHEYDYQYYRMLVENELCDTCNQMESECQCNDFCNIIKDTRTALIHKKNFRLEPTNCVMCDAIECIFRKHNAQFDNCGFRMLGSNTQTIVNAVDMLISDLLSSHICPVHKHTIIDLIYTSVLAYYPDVFRPYVNFLDKKYVTTSVVVQMVRFDIDIPNAVFADEPDTTVFNSALPQDVIIKCLEKRLIPERWLSDRSFFFPLFNKLELTADQIIMIFTNYNTCAVLLMYLWNEELHDKLCIPQQMYCSAVILNHESASNMLQRLSFADQLDVIMSVINSNYSEYSLYEMKKKAVKYGNDLRLSTELVMTLIDQLTFSHGLVKRCEHH